MSGALLTTAHRYLGPNSQETFSIKKVLSDSGMFSQAGSIEVVTPENSAAVLGQLSITRVGTDKAYLDEELFMPDVKGSHTLRAVIDSPENSPIVAITNVSTTDAQTLQINCIPSMGAAVGKSLILQPKQTQLVRACSTLADRAFSPDGLDRQFILAPESSAGMAGQRVAGISITSQGPAGEIAAFGFVEHADEDGRYFSAMNFSDPQLLHSTGTVFTGVPVGASAKPSGDVYTAQVAVTNFSRQPQTATVSLATTSEGLSETHQAAEVALPPGTSRLIDLTGVTGQPDWRNSFVVRSSGAAGDVVSKMMFKTHGALPNIELRQGRARPSQRRGPSMVARRGMRSILYLFNHGAATRPVTVRIGSGAEVWIKIYDLHPNETRAVSIGEVVANALPDEKGHVLSGAKNTGEVGWWAPSDGYSEVSGRVVQQDSGAPWRATLAAVATSAFATSAFPQAPFLFILSSTMMVCSMGSPFTAPPMATGVAAARIPANPPANRFR